MSDLGASEQAHGRSPSGVFWLIRSGWGKRQRSLDGDTPGDTDNLHFPGLAKQAAQFLIDQRRVKAVGGIDTPSIDQGVSQDFARQ